MYQRVRERNGRFVPILTADWYCREILDVYACPNAGTVGPKFILMDDGASKSLTNVWRHRRWCQCVKLPNATEEKNMQTFFIWLFILFNASILFL